MANKKRNNKRWLWIAALLLVLIVVMVLVANKRKHPHTDVSTEAVALRTIVETVAANGKIQPVLEVKISPYISGEVVELYVREGEYVLKDAILAKIDPTIYQSTFEQVEASLNSAKANMANTRARVAQAEAQYTKAKLDLDRNEQLFKQNVISQADIDNIRANYQVTTAELEAAKESLRATQFQVQNAEAGLREARENLRRTSIYAPSDGTVSKLNVEVGERVTGASQFSSGTEIMRLANLNEMEVKVEVSENDIPRVKLNDTCMIEVDAYLGRKFNGYVTEIATSANTQGVSVDQVTNFDVKIMMLKESYADLIKPEEKIASPFRPGMSATVDIQTNRVDQALSIPIQAVTTREDTSNMRRSIRNTNTEDKTADKSKEIIEYVFVASDNKAKIRAVKTGVQDNTYIQILEGISLDEIVITGPYRVVSKSLKNGDEIKIVEKDKLFETK
ncbi:MAG: efflux RND transporter periplasmic adaptor subunit [Bacteroidales bacterium]|jgi:HlyD family secretion protein|nr:efflux RND transporter periplasmic adaptor subunit [Bacteroidales bacterium]MDD3702264.1 efflux RND transporter periplasmic adaptor subunit [Bacteroidales bacterium]MDY0368861.1 efflux RND transporter periplasmic adaptor subunit [Bacteroidales bacterium]